MNKMDLDCFGNLRFFFLLRYKNDMMICFISLPNPHQLLLLLFFPSSFLSSFAFSSTAISHYTSASCSSSAFASFSSPSVCSNSSVSHSAHPPLFCFFDVFCFCGLPVELFFIILTQDSRLTQSFKRLKIVFHSGRKHSGSSINIAAVKKWKGLMLINRSYSKHHSVGMGGGSFAFAGSIASFCLALLKAYCQRTKHRSAFCTLVLADRIKSHHNVVLPLPGPSRILPLLRCSLHS